jgi:hypothetical protein
LNVGISDLKFPAVKWQNHSIACFGIKGVFNAPACTSNKTSGVYIDGDETAARQIRQGNTYRILHLTSGLRLNAHVSRERKTGDEGFR